MTEKDFITLELESLTMRYFLDFYAILEKKIKYTLKDNMSIISEENQNLLRFYETAISMNLKMDYNDLSVNSKIKFSNIDSFNDLSANNIIKIHRKNHLLEIFETEIKSINRKTTLYKFSDCCVKLINMRNKLAHEMDNPVFNDNEIIELLPDAFISDNAGKWYSYLDVSRMNDSTKAVFSNLIYLCILIETLEKKEKEK